MATTAVPPVRKEKPNPPVIKAIFRAFFFCSLNGFFDSFEAINVFIPVARPIRQSNFLLALSTGIFPRNILPAKMLPPIKAALATPFVILPPFVLSRFSHPLRVLASAFFAQEEDSSLALLALFPSVVIEFTTISCCSCSVNCLPFSASILFTSPLIFSVSPFVFASMFTGAPDAGGASGVGVVNVRLGGKEKGGEASGIVGVLGSAVFGGVVGEISPFSVSSAVIFLFS